LKHIYYRTLDVISDKCLIRSSVYYYDDLMTLIMRFIVRSPLALNISWNFGKTIPVAKK